MRELTQREIAALVAAGNSAEDWHNVVVEQNFDPTTIRNSHFAGRVEIEEGVTITNSTLCNYHIGHHSTISDTTRLECRHRSSFGNGVSVAAVNENGGRSVTIYNDLTAQGAYIVAMYRHRSNIVEASKDLAKHYAAFMHKDIGTIGANCSIVGARFIREVNMADGVTICGASLIENATLLEGSYVGIDVKAVDFIAAQGAVIDFGAIVERCFVGENVIVSKGFTAVDSLLFANSHLENGEACSIFAGPYTVSHHKSSLLIAGIFSFFNAGSGTNQSNHLFKSGAIHQAVHRRGCKFGSNGYVMSPAAEGEFTVVLGRHSKHHDTSDMPFSYLIESNGTSTLLPAFALRSYGTVRDIKKWQQRDKRTVCRDIISYNPYNPYLAGKVIKALDILQALSERYGADAEWHYNNTTIKRAVAQRSISLYKSYLTASLGAMLSVGKADMFALSSSTDRWVDLAGQYVSGEWLEKVLSSCSSIADIGAALQEHHKQYDNFAYSWAVSVLSQQLGRVAEPEDIVEAIAAGSEAQNSLSRITDADREADTNSSMSIGYGIDATSQEEVIADFNAVHNL